TAEGSGGVTLDANLISTAKATGNMFGLALGGSGSFTKATVSATPTVRANFSSGAIVEAAGDITAHAKANVIARADGKGSNFALGIGFSGAQVTATSDPTVEARSVSGGSLTGDNITFIAETTNSLADAKVTIAAGALLAGVAGGSATATSTSDVDAGIGTSTGVYASGDLRIEALSDNNKATSEARGSGIGTIGVGAANATSTASSDVEAYMKGSVGDEDATGAVDLNILASAEDTAVAKAQAVAGGLVAGTDNDSNATANSKVSAYLGNNSFASVSDDISITAKADPEADSSTKGVTGGLIGVGASQSTTTVTPQVSAYIGSGAVIHADGM